MQVTQFNLRVYGLLINDLKVLITHEHRSGILMTKFPGGGLEKGEGLADGLRREFTEELSLAVEVADLFYVNDFFQLSALNPAEQLISFYYFVNASLVSIDLINTETSKHLLKPGNQEFEWVAIADLLADEFNFPIDRVVVQRLKEKFC